MSLTTIILFFVYTWGLGFTATALMKNSENFLERNMIRVGIGIGVLVALGTLLNLLHIPLDWKIFLLLSITYPLFILIKKIKNNDLKLKLNLKLTKSNLNILFVLLIFLFCLFMYVGGSFKYPYFEDDDPWSHSMSVKYIATEKTAYEPDNFNLKYLDPYPPGYGILMGVLHQTSPFMMWTLKFFNGLILSLGIVFFYFFTKLFTGSRNKALFSTFVIAALPSFFTHFIWAHTLVVILIFPAMYCLEMVKKDKKWKYVSAILISSILLTQPSQAIKIGLMIFIYFVVKCVWERKFLIDLFLAQVYGVILSFMWWGVKAQGMLAGRMEVAVKHADKIGAAEASGGILSKISFMIQNYFRPDLGTATKAYSFNDFFIVKPFGGINIHVGWGIFITLLLTIGIIYALIKFKESLKKENVWIGISLAWFIFTFLGVNAMTFNLPVGFITFRFWLLLAIPVALLSSEGLWALFKIGKKVSIPSALILIVVLVGIFTTAGYQKYNHNTLPNWPPGIGWTSTDELQGYLWLKTLPADTKVFTYYYTGKISGLNKYSCDWCSEVIEFRKTATNKTASELNTWLKRHKYEYMILSGSTAKKLGVNKTNEKLQELASSNLFVPAHQTKDFFAFKVI